MGGGEGRLAFPGGEEWIEAFGPAGQELLERILLYSLGNPWTPFRNILEAARGGLPEKDAHFILYFPVTG